MILPLCKKRISGVVLTEFEDVTGVLLAGGQSQRMGRDKATLPVGGVPLYRRALTVLRSLFAQVLIAGDRPDLADEGVACHRDIYPGSSLGGLYTGLLRATTPHIFVAACDMPSPDPALIRTLLSWRRDFDVVVPRTPAGLEPLFACYGKGCLAPMEELLRQGRYRIYDFYDQVRVRYVEADELPPGWRQALCNVNTPADMATIKEELS